MAESVGMLAGIVGCDFVGHFVVLVVVVNFVLHIAVIVVVHTVVHIAVD